MQNHRPRIVLIDDDPSYCAVMARVAAFEEIELDAFTSLAAMGSVGRLADYDVAVVDYDLGGMNGVEIAEYMASLFNDKPMVLVSNSQRQHLLQQLWPASIKAFALKSEGYRQVLRKALVFTKRTTLIPSGVDFGEKPII